MSVSRAFEEKIFERKIWDSSTFQDSVKWSTDGMIAILFSRYIIVIVPTFQYNNCYTTKWINLKFESSQNTCDPPAVRSSATFLHWMTENSMIGDSPGQPQSNSCFRSMRWSPPVVSLGKSSMLVVLLTNGDVLLLNPQTTKTSVLASACQPGCSVECNGLLSMVDLSQPIRQLQAKIMQERSFLLKKLNTLDCRFEVACVEWHPQLFTAFRSNSFLLLAVGANNHVGVLLIQADRGFATSLVASVSIGPDDHVSALTFYSDVTSLSSEEMNNEDSLGLNWRLNVSVCIGTRRGTVQQADLCVAIPMKTHSNDGSVVIDIENVSSAVVGHFYILDRVRMCVGHSPPVSNLLCSGHTLVYTSGTCCRVFDLKDSRADAVRTARSRDRSELPLVLSLKNTEVGNGSSIAEVSAFTTWTLHTEKISGLDLLLDLPFIKTIGGTEQVLSNGLEGNDQREVPSRSRPTLLSCSLDGSIRTWLCQSRDVGGSSDSVLPSDSLQYALSSEGVSRGTPVWGLCADPCGLVLVDTSTIYVIHGDSRDMQSNIRLLHNHTLLTFSPVPALPEYWLLDVNLCVLTLWKICAKLGSNTALVGLPLAVLHAVERLSMDTFEDRPSSFSRLKKKDVQGVGYVSIEVDPLKESVDEEMKVVDEERDSGDEGEDGELGGDAAVSGATKASGKKILRRKQNRRGGGASDIGAVLASQRIPFLRSRIERVLRTFLCAAFEVCLLIDPSVCMNSSSSASSSSSENQPENTAHEKNFVLLTIPIDTEKISAKLRIWSCLHLMIRACFAALGEEPSEQWATLARDLRHSIVLGGSCVSLLRAAAVFSGELTKNRQLSPEERLSLFLMASLVHIKAGIVTKWSADLDSDPDPVIEPSATSLPSEQKSLQRYSEMLALTADNLSTISQIGFLVSGYVDASASSDRATSAGFLETCPICRGYVPFIVLDTVDADFTCCPSCGIASRRCCRTLLLRDVDETTLHCRLCSATLTRHVGFGNCSDTNLFDWTAGYQAAPLCAFCSISMQPVL